MAIRRTLMRSEAGVKLIRVEELSASQKLVSTHYRLSTLRPAQPRVIAEQTMAEAAFRAEVAASCKDPTAMRLAAAGH